MVSKSGTNQIHGTLFDYLRNKDFNANNFFNQSNGAASYSPVPTLIRNQFGGTHRRAAYDSQDHQWEGSVLLVLQLPGATPEQHHCGIPGVHFHALLSWPEISPRPTMANLIPA